MKNLTQRKQAFAPILILLLLGLVAAGVYEIAQGNANLGAAIGASSGYIERPIFKYAKCEALSGLKYSDPTDLSSNGAWLPKPSVGSSYNAKVQTPNLPGFTAYSYQLSYSVCNSQSNSQSNCRIYNQITQNKASQTISIDGVKSNEYVFVQYQHYLFGGPSGEGGATYQIGWVPYGIREYDVLSGSSNPINQNDCRIPSSADSWQDRLISTDINSVQSKISPNVNQNVMQTEEVRWYVSGYVTSAAPSFTLTYNGKQAWCRTTGSSAQVYKINSITVGEGTFKVASPDYSDLLGTLTCCPGQTIGSQTCNSDGTGYIAIQGSQCSAFKSCGSPNPVPYSSKQTIQYSCDNGVCKSQINNVACANDADCQDSNKVCDPNSFTCKDANVNLQGQSIDTTPTDQAACDAKGWNWIPATSTASTSWYTPLTFGLLGNQVTNVEAHCEKPASLWVITFWIIFWVLLAYIVFKFLPFVRHMLKAIPYVGRFIP